jgi:deazaflavin-dependent oxidoreductase (nitroreductase family)
MINARFNGSFPVIEAGRRTVTLLPSHRGLESSTATALGQIVNKRRISTFISSRLFNPLVKAASNRGIPLPGIAILETSGRRSGLPRRTPVGKSVDADTLWIVAEHGRRASYVRNIEANPRVRVKLGRRWRTGVAHILPGDDPRARQRSMPRLNALVVRAMGSDLLTVRVDLDPIAPPA